MTPTLAQAEAQQLVTLKRLALQEKNLSLPTGHIKCHGCDYQGVMQRRSVTLRYRLPGGETVDNHRTFGWCEICAEIHDVEAPLNASTIRLEISEQSPPRRKSLGGLFKNAVDRALGGNPNEDQGELQRLNALLRLAELRRSHHAALLAVEHPLSISTSTKQGRHRTTYTLAVADCTKYQLIPTHHAFLTVLR